MRNLEYSAGRNGVDRETVLRLIKTLLGRGADANARTAEIPPLRRFLMGLGDLSWVDFTGQTPFLRAALSGDVTVMKLLLENGADPNISDFRGHHGADGRGRRQLGGRADVHGAEGIADGSGEDLSRERRGHECREFDGPDARCSARPIAARTTSCALLVEQGRARWTSRIKKERTPMVWAQGVFLATNPPERKPRTIALIEKLQHKQIAAKQARGQRPMTRHVQTRCWPWRSVCRRFRSPRSPRPRSGSSTSTASAATTKSSKPAA